MDLNKLKGGLIVSCQALEDEPLHSSFIMGRMALAAKEGGAIAIRANSPEDIKEIKMQVDLPVIGIIKKDYDDSEVYITPTMSEIDALVEVNCDIIALDATSNIRPNNTSLSSFISDIRNKYENITLMADCSTYEELVTAINLGFDIVSTTLVGYTSNSKNISINENDFALLQKMIKIANENNCFIIAEGNIDTPQKVRRVFELGVDSVVVGSMITRPQLITKKFTSNMYSDIKIINNTDSIDFSSGYILYADEFHFIQSNILYTIVDTTIYNASGLVIAKDIDDSIAYLREKKYI